MRDYESTFILAPTLDQAGVQAEIDAVKGVITGQGGEITAEKEWGRRRLAYPIEDHSEGVYHILRFNLEGAKLAELNRHFRLNENVLRSLVIRDEGTPLDYVGQVPESDDHDRDRRGPRDEGRYRGPRSDDRDGGSRSSAAGAGSGGPAAEASSGEGGDTSSES